HLELRKARQPRLELLDGPVCLLRARADILALAAIRYQRDDAFQWLALLVEKHGVEQRDGERREGGKPHHASRPAEKQAGDDEQCDRDEDGGEPDGVE